MTDGDTVEVAVDNPRADYIFNPVLSNEKYAVEDGVVRVSLTAASQLRKRGDVEVPEGVPDEVVGEVLGASWQRAVEIIESGEVDDSLEDLAALEHRDSVLEAIDKR